MGTVKAPDNGVRLDDVRRQLALTTYVLREMKGLDMNYLPDHVDLDEVTKAFYRSLMDRGRTSRPVSPNELFLKPLFLMPPE